MLKAGVIGVGSMGRHHARILSELDHCELVGVADTDETKAEVAARYGAPFFSDHRSLLVREPRLVVVATPTAQHYSLACDALDAGCHLLIEKPLCGDLQRARELVARAEALALTIAVGHTERFNPAVGALRGLIQQGELGEVLTVNNLRVGPYHGRRLDTGIILDLGIHDVDLISVLFGESPQRVFATSLKRVHHLEDHAVLQLAFSGGRAGVIELSWNAPYRMRNVLVSGTRRYALCDLLNQRLMVYEEHEESARLLPQPYPVVQAEPLRRELESVIAAVVEGREPECSAQESVTALAVCLAALRSAESGEAEPVAES